jgi:amino acid transporter
MKRTITTFGLISGAIVSALMVISMSLTRHNHTSSAYGMVVGYASMLLAFCLIYVAVKNYRDKHLDGNISFGKAFMIGLGVALIASVCYTISWIIFYKGFYPDFIEEMTRNELNAMRKSGKSAAEIAAATTDMEKWTTAYKTWPGLIGMTLMEILPVGILVSVISALILKRRTPSITSTPQFSPG